MVRPVWWNRLHDEALDRLGDAWVNWRSLRREGETITAFEDLVEYGAAERKNIPTRVNGIAAGCEIEFRRVRSRGPEHLHAGATNPTVPPARESPGSTRPSVGERTRATSSPVASTT